MLGAMVLDKASGNNAYQAFDNLMLHVLNGNMSALQAKIQNLGQ